MNILLFTRRHFCHGEDSPDGIGFRRKDKRDLTSAYVFDQMDEMDGKQNSKSIVFCRPGLNLHWYRLQNH